MSYYVLLRRKGSKKIVGAIPTRKGAKISNIRKQVIRDGLNKYMSIRIISKSKYLKLRARLKKKKLMRKKTSKK